MLIRSLLFIVVLFLLARTAMANEKDLRGFWEISDYAKKNHPPASEEDIVKVEKKFGVSFPIVFRRLYLLQNGGRVARSFYKPGKTEEAQHPFVEDLFKLAEFESMKELASTIDFGDSSDWTKKLKNSEKLIIITRHGNDWMLCLDFRTSADPEVVLWDTVDEPVELLRVRSFKELVAGLEEEENEV